MTQLLTIACKFGLYVFALLAPGLVLNVCAFSSVHNGFPWRVAASGMALGAMGFSLLSFAANAVALTGDISSIWDTEMISLLWQTPVGEALKLRVLGLGLLALGVWLPGIGLPLAVIGSTLTLWSFTVIGHLSDASFWARSLVLVHLSVASFWIGILLPLKRLTRDEKTIEAAAALGERFGRLATAFVPTLLVAGVIMAWLLVGNLKNLATSYGITLLCKVTIVCLLLAFAAANKLRFVPAMKAGDRHAAAQLSRSITFEGYAFLVILLCTAVLTSAVTLPT